MRINNFKLLLFLFLVMSAGFSNLPAQLQLGSKKLIFIPAPALCNSEPLSIGLKSQKFMATIGGIAFDKKGIPEKDADTNNLIIDYRPDVIDGKRLEITAGGKHIRTNIYDWQLIPIVKFAESNCYSCFTLFGKLNEPDREKEILDDGGKILNYHMAFANTLIGLRLFQSDILILQNDCTGLPMESNNYILGNGESKPDVSANQQGMNNFIYHINGIESGLQLKFRSYVICDYGQDIRSSFQGDSLSITGNPFYYCWRYKMDDKNYDQKKVQERVLKEISLNMQDEKKTNPGIFDERKWYIQSLLGSVKDYEAGYNIYSSGTIVDLLKIKGDSLRIEFLEKYYTASLYEMLANLHISMDAYEIVFLKEYSERLSKRSDLFRGINPAVWEAAVNTMCYASFFRFYKEKYPVQWKTFLEKIKNAPVEPKQTTPTVMMDSQKK